MQHPAGEKSTDALTLALPNELVNAIAVRVAAMLAERSEPTNGYLDVAAAAKYLACSKQRIYDLTSAGRLRPARDGSRLLFRAEWLDEYLGNSDELSGEVA